MVPIGRTSPEARRELRLGVTGHRVPPKLPDESIAAIRSTIARLLDALASPAGHLGGPGLVVVSSLAEGADQIVAEEGLAHGAKIEAVLPFPAEEYSRDFSHDGVTEQFRHLLGSASEHHVVHDGRDHAPRSYEAAGQQMLARSDLLLAIWDESAADGRGGTAHVVADAQKAGIPVLLINPATPDLLSRIPGPGVAPEPAEPWLFDFAARMAGAERG